MRLIAENLCVDRGGRRLFEALSFRLEPREALLLTGPNGAGKTTLLRLLAGFTRPLTGQVALEGANSEIAENCHYLGHRDAVKARLTAAENASFWARYLGGSPARVTAALDRLGLLPLADVPAGYLSTGQRRRLGLSRLLVADRPLWLLDEPTASLDSASAATLTALMREHLATDGLIVAATHLPLEIGAASVLRLGEP